MEGTQYSSHRQRIVGKRFDNQNPDIVFAWDQGASRSIITESLRSNPNLPLNRGKESETNYQQQSRQIHGQRINLHESTNENKRVIARSNPRGENRTLTPPPQRVSSAQREKAKYEDNPHRIHHKPGSTVPNLKAGSERTNRAAKWLVEEQYKVGSPLCSPHEFRLSIESIPETRPSQSSCLSPRH
jgi:hypothetical protein